MLSLAILNLVRNALINNTVACQTEYVLLYNMLTAQQPTQLLFQSFNYPLPSDRLTLKVYVPSGIANVYGSFTLRNPSYFTADVMTGGSGILTLYIPFKESETVYISALAKKPNTTFLLNVEIGDVATTLSKFTTKIIWCCNYCL